MRRLPIRLLGALLQLQHLLVAYPLNAQEAEFRRLDGGRSRTFRPVLHGARSMRRFVDETGGNSGRRTCEFWNRVATRSTPLVAGAGYVLALVNPGVQWSLERPTRTVILVYRTQARKRCTRSMCRGNRTKAGDDRLAYNKNNGGKIPNSDGLLSASLPGVIDAWHCTSCSIAGAP